MSDNLNVSKWGMSKYFKDNLFKPVKIEKTISYGRNHLQIAKRVKDGRTFYLDLSEACRILILGATRCMPRGTKVRVAEGVKNIEDCDYVLSYNFDTFQVEKKKCVVSDSGKQQVVKIKLSNGEIVRCSPNHSWFVIRDNKRMVVQTRELLKTDKLLRLSYGEN